MHGVGNGDVQPSPTVFGYNRHTFASLPVADAGEVLYLPIQIRYNLNCERSVCIASLLFRQERFSNRPFLPFVVLKDCAESFERLILHVMCSRGAP